METVSEHRHEYIFVMINTVMNSSMMMTITDFYCHLASSISIYFVMMKYCLWSDISTYYSIYICRDECLVVLPLPCHA